MLRPFRLSLFLCLAIVAVPLLSWADAVATAPTPTIPAAGFAAFLVIAEHALAALAALMISWKMIGPLRAFVLGRLGPLNVHTHSDKLDRVLKVLWDSAEDVIRAEISGPLLDQLVASVAGGPGSQPIGALIAKSLTDLARLSVEHMGPALATAFNVLMGSPTNAENKARAVVLGMVREVAEKEQARRVDVLASGRKVVSLSSTPPAEGATPGEAK